MNQIEEKARRRLLVVEDDLVNQEVALGLLENLGYGADIAPDGESALCALQQIAYALVLTDCQLPGMDGYELARMIRNPGSKVLDPQIPIIAVTAHSLPGERQKCLGAGMNDFMTKPILPEVLGGLLSRWIAHEEGLGEAASSYATNVQPEAAPKAVEFDADDLIERLMGNEELAKRLAGVFIDSIPQQLVNLANAIGSFDTQATRNAAHSIKGMAANLGAVALQNAASKIEDLGQSGSLTSAATMLPELAATFQSVEPMLRHFRDSKD